MAVNKPKVRMYRDKKLKWRWQVKAANNEIIGASSQGYVRKVDCTTNLHRLLQAFEHPIRWTKGSEHRGNLGNDQNERTAGVEEHAV